MPKIGEIKRDSAYRKYMWVECIDCGEPKWTVLLRGKPQSRRCRRCAPKHRDFAHYKRGQDNPSWIRGWKINKNGYKEILIQPDDFFYSMVKKDGYVLEHRLVVAKALGRCLHRWEIVHHKGVKYPKGSIENRQDNRYPENLQLVSDDRHNQISILETRIAYLEKENKELKRRLKDGR